MFAVHAFLISSFTLIQTFVYKVKREYLLKEVVIDILVEGLFATCI
jgi:hypothetical protein